MSLAYCQNNLTKGYLFIQNRIEKSIRVPIMAAICCLHGIHVITRTVTRCNSTAFHNHHLSFKLLSCMGNEEIKEMNGIHSKQPNRIILVNCRNNTTELQLNIVSINVCLYSKSATSLGSAWFNSHNHILFC